VRLDDLRGRIGGGAVTFGGYVGLTGFKLDEFNVTAHGTNMHLRYPEGFDSYVDADLSLRNSVAAPFLGGTVTVHSTTLTRRLENGSGLLAFLTTGEPGPAELADELEAPLPSPFPLTMEVRVVAGPGTIRIDDQIAHMTAHANLSFSGTFQKPIANGSVEIDRGQVLFLGNLYHVRSGSIEFSNPNANIPFFDVEADTRVRMPASTSVGGSSGQDYIVHVRVSGTKDSLAPDVSSEPALPRIDVLSLLFGNPATGVGAEVNAVGAQQEEQLALLGAASAKFLAAPLSATVQSALNPIGIDAAQLTPLLTTDPSLAQINPGARLILGKRLSDRAFLTYSRDLNGEQLEVIVLEFEQNERISWVVSRNEDLSYSLDFRVRHVF
jgi:autotransporter translocation and assembly factor TamB